MANKRTVTMIGNIISGIIGGVIFLGFLIFFKNIIFALIAGAVAYLAGFLMFGTKKSRDIDISMYGITDEELKKVLTDGLTKMQIMIEYKNKIKNQAVKQKVNNICQIVKEIFDDIKKDPQDIKAARQFLSYYLDATIKILRKYTELSSHRIQSSEMASTLSKTENLLDTIKKAFEKQLANLLSNDVMDLDTEVKVLNQTLRSEGLSEGLEE